jgi:hypothetical protein
VQAVRIGSIAGGGDKPKVFNARDGWRWNSRRGYLFVFEK